MAMSIRNKTPLGALLYAAYVHASFTSIYWMNNTLGDREVCSPPITSPDSSSTWSAGQTAQVTWDVSSLPGDCASSTGKIVLGYLEDGSSDEHLDLDNPLASGFDLSDGAVEVDVPDVSSGDDYIVVLLGDSGDRSPTFTIE